uniref:Uncharacterized protein n=1 Tax=Mycena chlorophos TaxID=658473 RepID=A0ABQ0LM09_MYCCL|nr:predicted protein [Mycena chlorophos]
MSTQPRNRWRREASQCPQVSTTGNALLFQNALDGQTMCAYVVGDPSEDNSVVCEYETATGQPVPGGNGPARLGCPENIGLDSESSATSPTAHATSRPMTSTSISTQGSKTQITSQSTKGLSASRGAAAETSTSSSSAKSLETLLPNATSLNHGQPEALSAMQSPPTQSPPGPTTKQVSSESSARSHLPAAAIAGICIAIFVILLLAAAFTWLRLRRNRRRASPLTVIEAFPVEAESAEHNSGQSRLLRKHAYGLPLSSTTLRRALSTIQRSRPRRREESAGDTGSESVQLRELEARMRVLEETVLRPQAQPPPSY